MDKKDIDNFVWAFHRAKYKDRYFMFPFNTIIKIMEKKFGSFDRDKLNDIVQPFNNWFNYKGKSSKSLERGLQEYLYEYYKINSQNLTNNENNPIYNKIM